LPERGPYAARRRRRFVAASVALWTVLVGVALWWLLEGSEGPTLWIYDQDARLTGRADHFRAWFRSDIGFQRLYPWFLFGPYVALVAYLFPVESGLLGRNLVVHACALMAFVGATGVVNARTRARPARVTVVRSEVDLMDHARRRVRQLHVLHTSDHRVIQPPFGSNLVSEPLGGEPPLAVKALAAPPPDPNPAWAWVLDLAAYGAIAGLVHVVHFNRRLRERERARLLLESNLARARLHALGAQLQPHFLFNSLNAVTGLLRRDPRLAEETLIALSELLRLALHQSDRQEVALAEEMALIRRYVEIQQARFGDRLRVAYEVAPEAMDALVPALSLQPLVENALRHGIEPSEHGGRVRVSACRAEGRLRISVEDDGAVAEASEGDIEGGEGRSRPAADLPPVPGGRNTTARAGGIGLSNLRARLATLHGAEQRLELHPRREGGMTVILEVPWRSALPKGVSAGSRGARGANFESAEGHTCEP